jgi:hypothetical protein
MAPDSKPGFWRTGLVGAGGAGVPVGSEPTVYVLVAQSLAYWQVMLADETHE